MTNQTQENKIHKEMTIEYILSLFPHQAQKLAQEITDAGLHCVGCNAATWETLEGGMYLHGKTDAEIDHLVSRLNALLAEKTDPSTITLTPSAAQKFRSVSQKDGKEQCALRFGIQLAGCSGYEYILEFSEKAIPEEDEVFISEGIEIHVKKQMVHKVSGARIDYRDGLHGSGFTITNPNVKSSCGCGSSHGY